MRKFCWVYKNKKTGKKYRVQRPHRRAISPYWAVMEDRRLVYYAGTDFYSKYQFVGRLDAIRSSAR